MALRRYQHKFLQPLEIDQERIASSTVTNATVNNLTVTNTISFTPPSSLPTTLDSGLNITNTSTKTYPTTSSFTVYPGLYQNIELGTAQTIDAVTPGGFNFTNGIFNRLTKSAGNTNDIERLYFNGFNQQFNWTDQNTCKQYNGISDVFNYSGCDANGRISSSLNASTIRLLPADTRIQTISNTEATSGLIISPSGTSTVNIINSYNVSPSLNLQNTSAGTKTVSINNHTFLGTSPFWGVQGTTGTLNATITNLYGLRLTAPGSTTGLTVTNNWGIYQEWSNANNYFAGNIQMASGKGIDFSATNNSSGATASEIFDDYEYGVWTPGITQGTLGSATGVYTKVGRLVTIQFQISNFSNTSSTAAVGVTGLPFSNSGSYCAGTIFGRFISSGTGGPYTAIYVNGSTCTFYNTSTGAYDNMIYTRINNGTSCEIYGIAKYNAS
jgi:hypothetical protein